ncbi:MAG: outer membrane lipoprotein carrier protein LolA [Chitinophagaceae bacterium]|nr:outer membrane lipoprotein carrier protein LolA [Chitinophagaceae bacterium]
MKNLILLFLTLCFFKASFAQTDSKAKAILDKVSANLKSMQSMKANFTITISNPKTKEKQSKKGSFKMKGNKYYVSIGGQEIFCDNKDIYTFSKENNEAQITSFDDDEDAFSPSKIFTNFYDKNYTNKFIGEKTVNGKKVNAVLLTPINKNKQYTQVILFIDMATNFINSGAVYDKSGSIYGYTISQLVKNPKMDEKEFTFSKEKYPKVELVDLR